MQVIENLVDFQRSSSQRVAFVPTMGALHEGHFALIEKAMTFSDSVLVSVFVNPLQFEDPTDLEKYPRSPEKDIEFARRAGATAIWFPKAKEIFPEDVEIISAEHLGDLYEGASRPSHFSGMLTVVSRLFELVKPSWAVFGEKDYQQLFLVKKMVAERKLPISIIAVETVRDSDGLAISSRNARLSEEDRSIALVISQALQAAVRERNLSDARNSLIRILESEPRFRLDYAVVIDEETFLEAVENTLHRRALVAGWVNGVRLIDNMPMEKSAEIAVE